MPVQPQDGGQANALARRHQPAQRLRQAALHLFFVQRRRQLHRVSVVLGGQDVQRQQQRPCRVALGRQVVGDEVRVEIAQPREADDEHGLVLAQIARTLPSGAR